MLWCECGTSLWTTETTEYFLQLNKWGSWHLYTCALQRDLNWDKNLSMPSRSPQFSEKSSDSVHVTDQDCFSDLLAMPLWCNQTHLTCCAKKGSNHKRKDQDLWAESWTPWGIHHSGSSRVSHPVCVFEGIQLHCVSVLLALLCPNLLQHLWDQETPNHHPQDQWQ